jgi:hypothetical protein
VQRAAFARKRTPVSRRRKCQWNVAANSSAVPPPMASRCSAPVKHLMPSDVCCHTRKEKAHNMGTEQAAGYSVGVFFSACSASRLSRRSVVSSEVHNKSKTFPFLGATEPVTFCNEV